MGEHLTKGGAYHETDSVCSGYSFRKSAKVSLWLIITCFESNNSHFEAVQRNLGRLTEGIWLHPQCFPNKRCSHSLSQPSPIRKTFSFQSLSEISTDLI